MTSPEPEPQHWSPPTEPAVTALLPTASQPTMPLPTAPSSATPTAPIPSVPASPVLTPAPTPTVPIPTAPNQPTINLPSPRPGELFRFGPGIPVPAPPRDLSQATAIWRGEAQPNETPADSTSIARTRDRRRRLLTWLLPLLVLIAVIAILLWQHSGSPLAITNATVNVASPTLACDGTATITAEMRTNGDPGTITYRWRRSDGTVSDTLHQQVAKGSTTANVVLLWSFHGQGTMKATASLEVLSPTPTSASTTFTYTCPTP
jgi:hypothetical protein